MRRCPGKRAGQVSQSVQKPTFSLHSFQTVLHRFQAASQLLSRHDPATKVCVRVCAKAGEGRRIPAQGRAVLHPGEAQLERALLRSHAAHLQPWATTLRSAQSCWTSPAYVCSHCRLLTSWDVTAASGISVPPRHAARTAKGMRRWIFSWNAVCKNKHTDFLSKP